MVNPIYGHMFRDSNMLLINTPQGNPWESVALKNVPGLSPSAIVFPSLSQIKRMDIGKNIKHGGLETLFFFFPLASSNRRL